MTTLPGASSEIDGTNRAARRLLAGRTESRETNLRRFRPYPAYKASGVEWLGDIPAQWALTRLRFLVSANPSTAELKSASLSLEVSFVPMDAIGEWGDLKLETTKQLADVSSGYTYFRNGDVLVAKITPCFENGKGAIAGNLTNSVGFGTTELHVLRPGPNLIATFLAYLTFSRHFRDLGQIEMKGVAGQQRVPENFVKDFRVPLPPLSEQDAIATFLDRETAKIDTLVTKKERLIDLLQEKRTALITRAVTKGLDPNVTMKDSGVESLGEVPTHWEVMKVTWLFSIGSGTTPRSETSEYYGGEVPWVTTSELRESLVASTEKTVTAVALRDLSSLKLHPKGSVVVAMYGATIGRLGILGVPATVNQACCVFSNPKGIGTRFWFYWLQMRRSHLISLGSGGGQPNLSQDLLRAIRVPTPSHLEQRAIVDFLDRETAKIDALVAKVRDAIDRLKEFRGALISAAVTGKIDVRDQGSPGDVAA